MDAPAPGNGYLQPGRQGFFDGYRAKPESHILGVLDPELAVIAAGTGQDAADIVRWRPVKQRLELNLQTREIIRRDARAPDLAAPVTEI